MFNSTNKYTPQPNHCASRHSGKRASDLPRKNRLSIAADIAIDDSIQDGGRSIPRSRVVYEFFW